MSASNWARCPRCVAKRLSDLAELDVKVTQSYGAVPVEEFDRMRAEAIRQRIDVEDEGSYQTLCEDYEIYGAEDGVVVVSYSCGCQICGLGTNFNHKHPLDVRGTS